MEKTVYLVRHGKTAGNLKSNYVGGRTDESLCREGREELMSMRKDVPEAACLYISPMKRCIETASILYPELIKKSRYSIVENFRECDFGQFEGLSYKDMAEDPVYQKWIDQGGMGKFPGGEDSNDFIRRCVEAFSACIGEIWGIEGDIAMLVHGGTIMSILSSCAEPDSHFYDWHISCAGFFCLKLEKSMWEERKKIRLAERMSFS